MPELKIEVDPAEVGLDADRLRRIDRHLASYVDDGRLPGWQVAVTRRGKVAHLAEYGRRDVENDLPSEGDTIYRAWSMTKPVTSVAAMTLVEDGTIGLQDPVSRYIPAFENVRVYQRGPAARPVTTAAANPIRIQHLLSHTSGLTYGFHRAHPVDEIYTANGFEWATPPGLDLAACCERWASFPLLFEPGTAWNYGVSSDVLGRVVEVASGKSLDEFFAERVLGPLGMTDTAFHVPPEKADRLAAFYTADPATGRATRADHFGAGALHPPACLSGSAGLVTTLGDYHRFTQMLLGEGVFEGSGFWARAPCATCCATICLAEATCSRSAGRSSRRCRPQASASGWVSPWSRIRRRPECRPARGSTPGTARPGRSSGWTPWSS